MSFHFAGDSAYNVIYNNASVSLGANPPIPMSVSFWVKIPGGVGFMQNSSPIFALQNVDTTVQYRVDFGYNGFAGHNSFHQMVVWPPSTISSLGTGYLTTVGDGNWHNAVVIWGANSPPGVTGWQMFLDESDVSYTLVGSSVSDYSMAATGVHIGSMNHATDAWRVAEVGIWNTVLSSGDRTDLYTNRKTPALVQPTYLRHSWTLNYDHSANGRDDTKGVAPLSIYLDCTPQTDHPASMVYPTTASAASIVATRRRR